MEIIDHPGRQIWIIYGVIIVYFILGALGFYLINRKKPKPVARKSYLKFGTYFVIINLLFFSIVLNSMAFQIVALFIIAMGFYEMVQVFAGARYLKKLFFLRSVLLYGILATGFYLFSRQAKELVLFSFLVISIFDSFSQITGQLWGRRKILPAISPQKTVGGFVGGTLVSMISGWLLQNLYPVSPILLFTLMVGIVLFAFAGDLLASYYKRTYGVKDYSDLLPGHGGFLDRFDSLIAGSAWVVIFLLITNNTLI